MSATDCDLSYMSQNLIIIILSLNLKQVTIFFVGDSSQGEPEASPPVRPLEVFLNSKGKLFLKFTLNGLDWDSYPLGEAIPCKRDQGSLRFCLSFCETLDLCASKLRVFHC